MTRLCPTHAPCPVGSGFIVWARACFARMCCCTCLLGATPRCVQVAAMPVLAAARLVTQMTRRRALLWVIGAKRPAVVWACNRSMKGLTAQAKAERLIKVRTLAALQPPPPLLGPACPRLLWLGLVAVCAAASHGRGGLWASGLAARAARSQLASSCLWCSSRCSQLVCLAHQPASAVSDSAACLQLAVECLLGVSV